MKNANMVLAVVTLKSLLKNKEVDEDDEDDEDYEDDDEDDEDDEDEYVRTPKKVKIAPKKNRIVLKIRKPVPIKTLNELIAALDKSTKTIKITSKSKDGEKFVRTYKTLYSKSEKKQVTELVENLRELRDMIGMENVKQNIVNQLLLFLQDLHDPGMFLHTVLTGSPGSGKTTLCHILARIYKSMGFLD